MDVGWGLLGLAGSILAWVIAQFFIGPKEAHGRTESRLTNLEEKHNDLSKRFEGSKSETMEGLKHLTKAIDGLAHQLHELTKQVHSWIGRRSGPQR